MVIMDINQIDKLTRSEGLNARNCVYRVTEDCEAFRYDTDEKVKMTAGDLVCVSGCGRLSNKGTSLFYIDGRWFRIQNIFVEHYANPIMVRAKDQKPF